MRLIDADAMLKQLESWNTKDKMDKALYNFTWMRIMEQPTAYDVSKVIEKLLERAERVEEFGGYDNGKLTILTRHVIPISIAVDVVKKG